MEAYLRGLLLWEAIVSDFVTELQANPTLDQLKAKRCTRNLGLRVDFIQQ